jgi:hypothetical protein
MRSFNKDKAKEIHNDKFDYSRVNYINVDTKVIIGCPIHGDFLQTPYKHINNKQGCPKCRGIRSSNTQKQSFEYYVNEANQIHNFKYKYPVQIIQNAHTKVNIICPLHGIFNQNFSNHIYNKNGCPSCGYNVSKGESAWIESFNNKNIIPQYILNVNGKRYKIDGFDPLTNTVYEYFGKFWHGHPDKGTGINPRTKKLYSEHYSDTLNKIKDLEDSGYIVIQKWE